MSAFTLINIAINIDFATVVANYVAAAIVFTGFIPLAVMYHYLGYDKV